MPEFNYEAIDASGKRIEGVENAPDRDDLARSLLSRGLQPVRISKGSRIGALLSAEPFGRKGVGAEDLLGFTRELADLLEAGVTLERGLAILHDSSEKEELINLIDSIRDDIRGGKRLSEALARHPEVFDRLYVNMVRVGEMGGALPQVLKRLAQFIERSRNVRRFIINASIYPSILILVGIVSIIILVTFVVPKFGQIFQDLGQDVPFFTGVIINISFWLKSWWWLLVLMVAGAVAAVRFYLSMPDGRANWDRFLVTNPVTRGFVKRIELGRFSRTLGTLIESGVPILKGISLASEVVSNTAVRDGVLSLYSGIRQGKSMSQLMKQSDIFPPLMVHLVSVGEETGALDRMLLKLADDFEEAVQNDTKMLLALIEPVTIVVMGIVIGGIILSMLLAIFGINDVSF